MIDISQLTVADFLRNAINVAKEGNRIPHEYFGEGDKCCAIGASFKACGITLDNVRRNTGVFYRENSARIEDIHLKLHKTVTIEFLQRLQRINDSTEDDGYMYAVKELADEYHVQL